MRGVVGGLALAAVIAAPAFGQATGTLDPGAIPGPDRDAVARAVQAAVDADLSGVSRDFVFVDPAGAVAPMAQAMASARVAGVARLRGAVARATRGAIASATEAYTGRAARRIVEDRDRAAIARVESAIDRTAVAAFSSEAINALTLLASDSAVVAEPLFMTSAAAAFDGAMDAVRTTAIEEAVSGIMEVATEAYEAEVSERRQLAVLLTDPALERSGRPSNWSFAFTADRGEKEAKLQLNLCDAVTCPERSIIAVTLIGPVEKESPSTTLLDFDGLVGTSRIEVAASVGAVANDNTPARSGFVGTVQFRAAPGTFAFADPTTLAADKLEATLWSWGASAGHRWGTTALVQVGLERQQARKPGESQELCVPLVSPVTGASVCRSTPIGAPTELEQSVFSVLLASRIGEVAGIRVEGRRSSTTGDWLLDIPLYVIPDAEGALAGGVRLSHDFGAEESAVSLFVSLFKL